MLAAIGVGIGLGIAVGVTRLMQALLFGIDPLDPMTFVATPVVLAGAAALATYLPTRRAVALDPVENLRAELVYSSNPAVCSLLQVANSDIA